VPKMKSHRGAAKRFKKTATGKVKYKKAFKSHILGKKTAKRKRQLRKSGLLGPADQKRIKEVLPK